MTRSVLTIAAAAAVLTASLSLSACVTPTPYQPAHRGLGGYSETRIEPDRWRVTFTGNTVTSRDTVEGYLLYRAAELTLQNGGDWFAMVDRQTDTRQRTFVDADPFYHPWYGPGFAYWRPVWRYRGRGAAWRTYDPWFGGPFWGDTTDIETVQNFEATAEIVTHKGAKPADDARAFDAHAVVENLKPKIRLPGTA